MAAEGEAPRLRTQAKNSRRDPSSRVYGSSALIGPCEFAYDRLRRRAGRLHTARPMPPHPDSTAPSSPCRAATGGCSRRRPRWAPTSSCSTSRTPSPPTTRSAPATQVIERAARARLVGLLGLAAHQRARHALVLPRHRRRGRAGRRPARHDPHPEGRVRRRRPPRRDAADPDRGRLRLPHPIGISVLIETAAGHAPRRRDRRRVPGADGGDGVRRRRLRRVAAEPHHVDRRLDRRVLRPHRGRRAALGRPVALPARAHRGRVPRARAAADRRAVRRLRRPRGLPRRGAPRRGARLRGQVGDPPLPGRARERGLHARTRPRRRRRAGSSRRWPRRRARAAARCRSTAG